VVCVCVCVCVCVRVCFAVSEIVAASVHVHGNVCFQIYVFMCVCLWLLCCSTSNDCNGKKLCLTITIAISEAYWYNNTKGLLPAVVMPLHPRAGFLKPEITR